DGKTRVVQQAGQLLRGQSVPGKFQAARIGNRPCTLLSNAIDGPLQLGNLVLGQSLKFGAAAGPKAGDNDQQAAVGVLDHVRGPESVIVRYQEVFRPGPETGAVALDDMAGDPILVKQGGEQVVPIPGAKRAAAIPDNARGRHRPKGNQEGESTAGILELRREVIAVGHTGIDAGQTKDARI